MLIAEFRRLLQPVIVGTSSKYGDSTAFTSNPHYLPTHATLHPHSVHLESAHQHQPYGEVTSGHTPRPALTNFHVISPVSHRCSLPPRTNCLDRPRPHPRPCRPTWAAQRLHLCVGWMRCRRATKAERRPARVQNGDVKHVLADGLSSARQQAEAGGGGGQGTGPYPRHVASGEMVCLC